MGKPFKLQGDPGIVRGSDGRFQPIVQKSPPEILRQSVEKGIPVQELVKEARVADHATPKGKPQAAEEIEPMPMLRANDANRKPFRVG